MKLHWLPVAEHIVFNVAALSLRYLADVPKVEFTGMAREGNYSKRFWSLFCCCCVHALINSSFICWKLVECCFTSTETVGLLGTGAQDGHLHFHTTPEFVCWCLDDIL